MSQALCQRFYPRYLPSQECDEAGTIITFRLPMKRQRHMGFKPFASSQSLASRAVRFDLRFSDSRVVCSSKLALTENGIRKKRALQGN